MKRLVDSALWRSDKLKKVRAEFRAEFANLLPLAQANGSFELNPDRIWSDVYSYNRPEVTLEVVKQIVEAFIDAGMILRWRQEGKLWGHFKGITDGRLPKQSERGRGDYHITAPDPPHAKCNSTKGKRKTEPRGENAGPHADPASSLSLSIGSSLGSGSSLSLGEGVGTGAACAATAAPPLYALAADRDGEVGLNIERQILTICGNLRRPPQAVSQEDWQHLAELGRTFGADAVVEQFEKYIATYPASVTAFARAAEKMLRGESITVEPDQADALLRQLLGNMAGISGIDIVFTRAQQAALGRMLATYAEADIMWAYQEFYNKRDDFNMKFAARDWIETGEQYINTLLAERKRTQALEDATLDGQALESETLIVSDLEEIQ